MPSHTRFCFLFVTFFTLFSSGDCVAEVNNIPPKTKQTIPRIDFYPQELKAVVENELRHVSFGITWENSTEKNFLDSSHKFQGDIHVSVVAENPRVLEIVNLSFPSCIRSIDEPKNFSFTVKGILLGYTKVRINVTATEKGCATNDMDLNFIAASGESTWNFDLVVSVIRPPSLWVNVITGIMASFIAFNYINMGVQLDLHCIGKVLKKPIGPAIGFVCQFLFMPLASFGISLLLLDDASLRLGLFTLGCSPGGSMSNFWTLLFHGDVNLSITMTFISTIAALAMMPLWIFTLGASLFRDREATIPYINMAGSLILLTIPIGIGLLIQQYSPRLSKISEKVIRPFTFICIFIGVCFSLYAYGFIFSLFTWQIVLAGVGIAWGGYCFGALMAWLFKLEKAQIIAVSIETAFQNPAVAFVLLLMSLPQPDADLSSVPVIAQLLLTGLPMWALLIIRQVYKMIRKCYDGKDEGQIEKPEIDTVQKAYLALETNPMEDENIAMDPWKKRVDVVRFSS